MITTWFGKMRVVVSVVLTAMLAAFVVALAGCGKSSSSTAGATSRGSADGSDSAKKSNDIRAASPSIVNPAGATIAARFSPPPGFRRVPASAGSFAAWLRDLPLKPAGSPVLLFDGRRKVNQSAHVAVIDMDAGDRDLQQCADCVIRLRAEYLFAARRFDEIAFEFTSGDLARWTKWAEGYRPSVSGAKVTWQKTQRADDSRANFRRYLDCVFTYAGTISLARSLSPVRSAAEISGGDVFVKAGSPGHAVIVVDVAENSAGQRVFMLAQGFMPAQQMHVLADTSDAESGPWYSVNFGDKLVTPEWTFDRDQLRRFGR